MTTKWLSRQGPLCRRSFMRLTNNNKKKMGAIIEASSFDRINMTEFRLEHDRKILLRRTLTIEHEQKIYL